MMKTEVNGHHKKIVNRFLNRAITATRRTKKNHFFTDLGRTAVALGGPCGRGGIRGNNLCEALNLASCRGVK